MKESMYFFVSSINCPQLLYFLLILGPVIPFFPTVMSLCAISYFKRAISWCDSQSLSQIM